MISISLTTQFKTVCKFCNKPPAYFKKLGRFVAYKTDLLDLIKESRYIHDFYVIPCASIVEDLLNNRQLDKVKMAYLNFQFQDYKISTNEIRRYPIHKGNIESQSPRIMSMCKCQKTRWIFYTPSGKILPEYFKKSSVKK